MELINLPQPPEWLGLVKRKPSGMFAGRTQEQWRVLTRQELGLPTDRTIIATGHQPLMWHPGILAKYLVTDAFAARHELATANLVVDQDVGEFGSFDLPIRRADGLLGVHRVELCTTREDVPVGHHPAFSAAANLADTTDAIPSVIEGVKRIVQCVNTHQNEPNAAMQMASALTDLMQWGGWVRPMPNISATQLFKTSLAAALLNEMVSDPKQCAECYNRAVAAVPESDIGLLEIRNDRIELPVWRIGSDGKRQRGMSNDVAGAVSVEHAANSTENSKIQNPKSKVDLLPRALFMTALARLGMCDLFIHGMGGAKYDHAMELWIKQWLGVEVSSTASVTADVRLPLLPPDLAELNVQKAQIMARRLWHDPENRTEQAQISEAKRRMLQRIEALAHRSAQRRAAFQQMHDAIHILRTARQQDMDAARMRVERARQIAADRTIATRRDWAFPLYPRELIDELAAAARKAVSLTASAAHQ